MRKTISLLARGLMAAAISHFSILGFSQLQTAGGMTPTQLAQFLAGPGVVVSNVTLTGSVNSYGTFNSNGSNIGINTGVLLTSGDITMAPGPNINTANGVDNLQTGDADLDLLAGVPTFDACVLEFDFVPTCDSIQIAYVFGSEEYPEFVNAGFNDAFAFYISGPGFPTPTNIALIPGTSTPVTIDNVNNGNANAGPCTNCTYYVDNTGGATVEYDAFTTPLLALAQVVPCSTYHIKLAIADAGDGVYDSGVFLEEGGIRCTNQSISIVTSTVNSTNRAVEGCTDAIFNFERTGDLSLPLTVHFGVGGSAVNGVDYLSIPDSVVFGPGIDSMAITISAPDDGISEGLEIMFIIINDTLCGSILSDTAAILISDPPVAGFSFGNACPGAPLAFQNTSAFAGGSLSGFHWDFGDGTSSTQTSPSHSFPGPGTYAVELICTTPEGCTDTLVQSVSIYPRPTVSWTYSQTCLGQATQFTDGTSPGAGTTLATWSWTFGDGGLSPDQNPAYTYGAAGTFNASLIVTDDHGCRDTLVQPVVISPLPTADFSFDTVCAGAFTQFVNHSTMPGPPPHQWQWDFGLGNASTLQHPQFLFPGYGTYPVTLGVTTAAGCRDSLTLVVPVRPNPVADFVITPACFLDTTQFTDISTLLTGNLTGWDWDFGDGNGAYTQHSEHVYLVAGTYPVTLVVTSEFGCRDSITYPYEALPAAATPVPQHDTVCPGYAAQLYVPQPAGFLVEWFYDPASSTPFHFGTTLNIPPYFAPLTYWVDFLTPEGCHSIKVPIVASLYPVPAPAVTIEPREVEIPNALVQFGMTNANGLTVWWDFGDGSVSAAQNTAHQYTEEGTYTITLHVENEWGCEENYTYDHWVTVTQTIRLFAPNAFSPNGDGVNDAFWVITRLITDLSIQVYDRWGRQIYASDNLNFQWDGKDLQGADLPEGVYTYSIQAVGFDGVPLHKSGTLTLIR